MATMRDRSKAEWEGSADTQSINAGSLQRIADATEKMAANWSALTAERDRFKRMYEDSSARNAKRITELILQVRALKGVTTKLRQKAAKSTQEAA